MSNAFNNPSEAVRQAEAHIDAAVAAFDRAKETLMANPDFAEGYDRLMAGMTVMKIWNGNINDRPFTEVYNALLTDRALLNGREFAIERIEAIHEPGINRLELKLVDLKSR